ncbi:MAG: uracil-DNA glycosylase family protein [Gammaproteobacteria bacterium]|nr:uracil-DNA glycosylase family protein [Gammaproteobacteria bacterium]
MNANQIDYLQVMGIQAWHLKKAVYGAELMVIAAPEAEQPLANQLLQKMLDVLEREHVSLTYFHDGIDKQIRSINPKMLLVLGKTAAQALCNSSAALDQLRNQTHYYGETHIPLIVTYDPTELLQNPVDKRKAFHDLQRVLLCEPSINNILRDS